MANDDRDDDVTDPEVVRALVHVHDKLALGLTKNQELAAHVYALTEALIAAGLVKLDEIEERKVRAAELMMESARAHWEGAEILDDTTDKYTVDGPAIDCAARIHLCGAACCRLHFHLSRQDLEEAVVRWDVGRPYRIRHRTDGTCHHCDSTTKACDIHAQRPLVCRRFDCRGDARIWEDFDARVPSPKLAARRLAVLA
jgi:Fe-S-cluster containining protein